MLLERVEITPLVTYGLANRGTVCTRRSLTRRQCEVFWLSRYRRCFSKQKHRYQKRFSSITLLVDDWTLN